MLLAQLCGGSSRLFPLIFLLISSNFSTSTGSRLQLLCWPLIQGTINANASLAFVLVDIRQLPRIASDDLNTRRLHGFKEKEPEEKREDAS